MSKITKGKKKQTKVEMPNIKFGEIVDQCDSGVNKCPTCTYSALCKQIAENHVGKPYQYVDNGFTKNKTVNELLEARAM